MAGSVMSSILVDGSEICGQVPITFSEATREKYFGLIAPLGPFALVINAFVDFVALAQSLKHD